VNVRVEPLIWNRNCVGLGERGSCFLSSAQQKYTYAPQCILNTTTAVNFLVRGEYKSHIRRKRRWKRIGAAANYMTRNPQRPGPKSGWATGVLNGSSPILRQLYVLHFRLLFNDSVLTGVKGNKIIDYKWLQKLWWIEERLRLPYNLDETKRPVFLEHKYSGLQQSQPATSATLWNKIFHSCVTERPLLDLILSLLIKPAPHLRYEQTHSVALVRKRTKRTERPPLVCEVSANFCGLRGVAWSAQWIPTAVFSDF
jgi:hypothetical protein